jgi:hypothetical protein
MNGILPLQFLKFLQKLVEDAENEGKYISQKHEVLQNKKCCVFVRSRGIHLLNFSVLFVLRTLLHDKLKYLV